MVDIRVFEAGESPPELYRFRYAVYVEEMGRKQRYARHDVKTIIDPLDATGVNVIAFEDDGIIGCVRVNFLKDGPIGDYADFYGLTGLSELERDGASITTRLMIARARRTTPLTVAIVTTVYEYALRLGNTASYIDCNSHLVEFFVKFGYRAQFRKNHVEYGDVTVMRLDVCDHDHLSSVGSPFAPICRRLLDERRPMRPAQLELI